MEQEVEEEVVEAAGILICSTAHHQFGFWSFFPFTYFVCRSSLAPPSFSPPSFLQFLSLATSLCFFPSSLFSFFFLSFFLSFFGIVCLDFPFTSFLFNYPFSSSPPFTPFASISFFLHFNFFYFCPATLTVFLFVAPSFCFPLLFLPFLFKFSFPLAFFLSFLTFHHSFFLPIVCFLCFLLYSLPLLNFFFSFSFF